MKWLFLVFVGFFLFSPHCFAASCNVQSGILPFSSYNSLNPTSATVVSNTTITCTNPTTIEQTQGVIVQVSLSSGQGTILNRYLTNGSEKLYYNVYKDPAFQNILGDNSGNGSPLNLCLDSAQCGTSSTNTTGTTLLVDLYGSAPPHQDVSPGNYQDNVLLQISF